MRRRIIAPTVFIERPGLGWKQAFALYARALGREREAADTVRRYEERVRALNGKLPSPRGSISVVRILSTNNLRYYQRTNFIDSLLTDLGIPRPAPQNVDDFALDAGLESLGQYAPGDLIILALFGNQQTEYSDSVVKSPLWQGLPAVKAGKVRTVDDKTWIAGIGYRAAFAIFDELAGYYGVR